MSDIELHRVPYGRDPEVLITRVFAAAPARVFAAWTDSEVLVRWFAPTGCTIEFPWIDVQVGGSYHSCIHTPDGGSCWCKGEYLEVVEPQRLVFTMCATDETGADREPADLGMDPAWPAETTVTVELTPDGQGTRMVLRQTVSAALAQKTGALPSWQIMFDRLSEIVHST